jgi:hypothetical protein
MKGDYLGVGYQGNVKTRKNGKKLPIFRIIIERRAYMNMMFMYRIYKVSE